MSTLRGPATIVTRTEHQTADAAGQRRVFAVTSLAAKAPHLSSDSVCVKEPGFELQTVVQACLPCCRYVVVT